MRNLQEAVSAAATNGGSRQAIGEGITWGALPVPTLFPSLVAQQASSAIQFYVTQVSESGTPAATTAARAVKPVGATVATTSKVIAKTSGQALLALEDFEQSEAAIAAVVSTLAAQCAVAQDAAAIAALDAAVAEATPATTWVAAIAGGQAAVAAKGGTPNLVVVPALDWPALATEIATTAGLTTPSSDAILNVLGSRVVISPKAPAGESFVIDPSAVVTVLRDLGILVDAMSHSGTNEIVVVVDLVASTFVARPSGVVAIAKAP